MINTDALAKEIASFEVGTSANAGALQTLFTLLITALDAKGVLPRGEFAEAINFVVARSEHERATVPPVDAVQAHAAVLACKMLRELANQLDGSARLPKPPSLRVVGNDN